MKLDGASFLLQWATGGLAFLWVTTRRREVGLGYGWLLRGVYGVMAAGAAAAHLAQAGGTARGLATVASVGVVAATGYAAWVSVVRRAAGVSRAQAERRRRRTRVMAMLVGDAPAPATAAGVAPDTPAAAGPGAVAPAAHDAASEDAGPQEAASQDATGPEFPPRLDLVAPAIGVVGLLAAASLAGGSWPLAAARLLVGAAFLGAVSDAMLLGHWYLVQPGLPRAAVRELTLWTAAIWPFEVLVFVWPPGMVAVLRGSIDDGYGGLLSWIWLASALMTIALVGVTWAALRERSYSAVMAATGLLYLAILTAFGTDLIARAVLAP